MTITCGLSPFSSPSPSAESANLQSKLEALKKVEKLCEKYENVESNKNNPKKLLDNLCTGLETFLGFNSTSKGYDGTGIVYSDLDRLCDGVMGFLSGVLTNIKDHLGQHKNEITEAINTLNEKKHAGKKGFNAAIESVVAGVGGYNESVRDSNNHVKSKIEDLYTYVKTENRGKLRSDIHNMQDPENTVHFESAAFNAENLVKQAVAKSKHFATELNKATNDINDFNLDCKTSVNHALKNVKHETERLEQSAAKELRELKATEAMIKSTLEGVRQKITANIREDVTKLVKNCKATLQSILNQLKKISSKLEKYVKQLVDWMDEAAQFVDDAVQKIEKILQEMNENDAYKNAGKIKNAVTQMGTDIKTLHEAGKNVKEGIVEWVRTTNETKVNQLDGWKTAAQSVISGAIAKAKEVRDALDHSQKDDDTHKIGKAIGQIAAAKEAVQRGNNGLTEKVEELERWNDRAKKILTKAQDKRWEILRRVNDNDINNRQNGGTEITLKAKELEKKCKALLDAYETAHSGLGKLIEGIKGRIDGLKTHIVKDLTSLKGKVERKIEDHVTKIINAFLGAAGKAKIGLADNEDNAVRALGDALQSIEGLKALGQNIRALNHNDYSALKIHSFLKFVKDNVKFRHNAGAHTYDTLSEDSKRLAESIINEFKSKAGDEFKNLKNMESEGNERHDEFKKVMATYHENATADHSQVQTEIEKVKDALKDFVDRDLVDKPVGVSTGRVNNKKTELTAVVEKITTQLREITWLVDSKKNGGKEPDDYQSERTGITQLMDDLTNGLGKTDQWETNAGGKVSGLQNISDAISKLRRNDIDKSSDIAVATQNIRDELTSLRDTILLNGNKNDVINRLTDLHSAGFANSDTWPDQQSIKGFDRIKQDITTALDKIQQDVTSNLTIVDTFQNKDLSQFKQVIENLTKLCEDVKHEGEGAKSLLTALRDTNIRVKLEGIKKHIENLKDLDLRAVIQEAEKFLSSIDLTCESTIQLLGNSVMENICAAEKTLKTHARKQYVDAVKFLLEQFADKAAAELKPLPEKIAKDMELGHKGFLQKLESKFIIRANQIKNLDPKKLTSESIPLKQAASILSNAFKSFRINMQQQTDFQLDFAKIQPSYNALSNMLTKLDTSKHFDHVFTKNLSNLNESVTAFKPSTYGEAKCPSLLNALKKGMSSLIEELKKAYISTYSQMTIEWQSATAEEREKYAKICCTITPILLTRLKELKTELEKKDQMWKEYNIYNSARPTKSLCHLFFRDNGYDVGGSPESPHGELNHTDDCKGSRIFGHLTTGEHRLFVAKQASADSPTGVGTDGFTVEVVDNSGLMDNLNSYLQLFFETCHLIIRPKPRHPCSVYEMSIWLCGLQFNPVFQPLLDHIKTLFLVPEKTDPSIKSIKPIEASPSDITDAETVDAVERVCSDAYAVIVSILGHGHGEGVYACDYSSNAFNLCYPSVPSQCLDMLADILYRIQSQLYFLFVQCSRTYSAVSWRDCWYGQGVGGSSWQCNDKLCLKQTGNQTCNQKHDQTAGQHTECGLKSPLQSFLEDGLPGFMPHSLTKVGCGVQCSVSHHKGIPCKTPMGFAGISTVASVSHTGAYLQEVLSDFCGHPDSPLNKLCGYFTCMFTRPPQALGEMFAFYYNFLDGWYDDKGTEGQKHRKNAFDEAVNKAYFEQPYDELNVYSIFADGNTRKHDKGYLSCIVGCANGSAVTCGRYIKPVSHFTWVVFSAKNASLYLSWIVYLTETFYDLLKKLYDDCCNNCNKPGTRCHGNVCDAGCAIKKAYKLEDASRTLTDKQHEKNCKSIAKCPFARPTLYTHGFTLRSLSNMSGINGNQTKRTCQDLCETLKKLLDEDNVLFTLAYKTIPNYLLKIREPFIWLNVALWSLSLFYLICVMVGRLDVLHIRSHLKSPSSHRITAQSLLAAAQVGRLAKISYLQP